MTGCVAVCTFAVTDGRAAETTLPMLGAGVSLRTGLAGASAITDAGGGAATGCDSKGPPGLGANKDGIVGPVAPVDAGPSGGSGARGGAAATGAGSLDRAGTAAWLAGG